MFLSTKAKETHQNVGAHSSITVLKHLNCNKMFHLVTFHTIFLLKMSKTIPGVKMQKSNLDAVYDLKIQIEFSC